MSDVLRPYSALDYAWDEPGLPHVLLVDLPGSRSLGRYHLDTVCTLLLCHHSRYSDPSLPPSNLTYIHEPNTVTIIHRRSSPLFHAFHHVI